MLIDATKKREFKIEKPAEYLDLSQGTFDHDVNFNEFEEVRDATVEDTL